MKRHGYFFPQLCDFGHLLAAFRRALRGSGHSHEAQRFFFELEPQLLALQRGLQDGSYQPQPYRYFRIRDPKARIISVAPFVDRVVHHAIVALLEPIYEPAFIHDSYATRKGKGQHQAILQAQRFLQRERWFLKADVDQYFASIEHDRLMALLARKVKDRRFLALTERMIRNGGEDGRGLPIGNLTSQFFANVYLNPLDHFVKEELRVRGYLRYMDDFVLFAEDKAALKAHRKAIETFLAEKLALRLKPSATLLNQACHGLSYLGARIFRDTIRIHPANLRRSREKLRQQQKAYGRGRMSEERYLACLQSRWAYLSWFDSEGLRREILKKSLGYF